MIRISISRASRKSGDIRQRCADAQPANRLAGAAGRFERRVGPRVIEAGPARRQQKPLPPTRSPEDHPSHCGEAVFAAYNGSGARRGYVARRYLIASRIPIYHEFSAELDIDK